jgi:glycosyltransferase involved in cell wall biosynthesis
MPKARMTDPKISIAMATYNGANYLQEQLDSFTRQTRLPDELIVTDDGSTDDTVELLEAFRTIVPFAVRIYRNEVRLGFAKNFEKALSLCSGDIVFLSDQDDVWFPDKIERVVTAFVDKGTSLVINDQVLTDGALNPTSFTKLGNIESLGFSEREFITGCCTAVRSNLLSIILPIPAEMYTHDGWIHKICRILEVRKVIRTPLQYYRRHGGNASQWTASQPKRLSQRDVVKEYGLQSAVAGWEAGIWKLRVCSQRLEDRKESLEAIGLSEAARTGMAALERGIQAHQRRIAMMSIPRLPRSKDVLSFWLGGHYDQFSGWKSAVKDLVRRA